MANNRVQPTRKAARLTRDVSFARSAALLYYNILYVALILIRVFGNFSISVGKLKFNREIKTLASRENAIFLLNSGPFGDGKK